MKNKIYVSWIDCEDMAKQLAEQIKNSGKIFKAVYGIPRGGLPLAVYLSHNLGLPLVNIPSLGVLIVDDISDNGDTLFCFKNKYKIACLYSTSWTKVTPDFCLRTKKSPYDWIIFPWEKDDDKTEKNNL
jgi:hypoxanthine phosphoribosyltransferase